jgi:hypothetical protein
MSCPCAWIWASAEITLTSSVRPGIPVAMTVPPVATAASGISTALGPTSTKVVTPLPASQRTPSLNRTAPRACRTQ